MYTVVDKQLYTCQIHTWIFFCFHSCRIHIVLFFFSLSLSPNNNRKTKTLHFRCHSNHMHMWRKRSIQFRHFFCLVWSFLFCLTMNFSLRWNAIMNLDVQKTLCDLNNNFQCEIFIFIFKFSILKMEKKDERISNNTYIMNVNS